MRKIIMLVNIICIRLFVIDFLDNGLRPIDITLLLVPEYSRLPAIDADDNKMKSPMYTRAGLTGLLAIASDAFSRNCGRLDSTGRSNGFEPTLMSIMTLPIETFWVLPILSFSSVVLTELSVPSNPSIALPRVYGSNSPAFIAIPDTLEIVRKSPGCIVPASVLTRPSNLPIVATNVFSVSFDRVNDESLAATTIPCSLSWLVLVAATTLLVSPASSETTVPRCNTLSVL